MGSVGVAIDFQLLFESAPAAFLVLNPDLVIVQANDSYLASTGLRREAVVGISLFEAFPAGPSPAHATMMVDLRASLQRVIKHRTADTMPIRRYDIALPGRDGEFEARWWASMNAPVLGDAGRLLYLVHRTQDVTEYVLAHTGDPDAPALPRPGSEQLDQSAAEVFDRQVMQQRNQALQAVLDSLDTVVLGCDAAGRAVLSNRAARDVFGSVLSGDLPVAQWPQHLDVRDVDGRQQTVDDLSMLRALRGEQVRDVTISLTMAGNAQRVFRMHGGPVTGAGTLAAVVALHEITEQARATRLKECELQVSALLSQPGPADTLMSDAIALIGDMLQWSATEFWSLDPIGQVLRRMTCWAADGYQLPCELPDQLTEGEGLPGKAWQRSDPQWAADLPANPDAAHQTGDWGNLRGALAVPIPSGAATLGVLVCYSDIHETPDDMRTAVMTGIAAHFGEFLERRRAEQFAAELDQTRDEYIALVGHELRTPLTSIQAYTDMMLADLDLPTGDRAMMLEVMQRNTGSLRAIIANLLDVAGMRSGHITLQPQRMNLVALVHAAADAARADHRTTMIDVNTESAEIVIDGDPQRIRRVIDELLANALTWAPDGSTVGVAVNADDHTAVLAISNTGERIPADQHTRVFDLFFRTDTAQRHGVPGTGLGLTLARAVVEQHGGHIMVSEPDEAATTFTVRLPTHHHAHTSNTPPAR